MARLLSLFPRLFPPSRPFVSSHAPVLGLDLDVHDFFSIQVFDVIRHDLQLLS